MKSPIVLLQSLLNDISRLDCAKGTERDMITLSKRFEDEGYGFLAIALPSLAKALERGLADGKFTCPTGFKRVRGGTIPRLFSGMFREVFDSATGELKEDVSPGVVKSLLQLLRFFKKIPTDDAQTERLDVQTKESFVEVDRRVIREYPQDKMDYLLRVASFTLTSLHSWRPDQSEMRHGPGSVYDGETVNQKWITVCDAITQGSIDIDLFGLADFAYSIGGIDALSYPDFAISEGREGQNHRRRASSSCARLVTVPKSVTALRTITVEPCLNQFVQQGLNTALRDSINKCRVLSKSLALTDQSENQKLALEGSRTGLWSTLDLRSASDLLGYNLVVRLFERFPNFLEALIRSRTPDVIVGDRQFRLQKYAGMGNATTFPIQSVVFATLAIAALCYSDGLRPSWKNVIAAARCVRVFGDDIIVHTHSVHSVITWLEDFGLEINTAKSFTTGNFRESCGVDAFKGVDVTSFYARVRPCGASKNANTIASLVALSNHLWLNCYYEAAQCIAQSVEDRLGRRLPLVRQCSEGIGWRTRQDAYEFTSYSRTLHRPEIKAYAIKPRKRHDVLDGYPALLKFFLTSLIERRSDHLEKTFKRYSSSIVWKRVAA